MYKTSKSIFDVVKKKQKQSVETGGEFRFAMDSGEAGKVAALLQQGASANSRVKSDPYPPLHYAIIKNRPDYVELLLEHGADLNALTNTNSSPLHCACFEGHKDLSLYLIELGASMELKNKRGFSALDLWNRRGRMDNDLSMAEGYLELK